MTPNLQIAFFTATVVAGFSGWAAIAAWWLRERTKTVQGIKRLRRTNDRLQKTVVFTGAMRPQKLIDSDASFNIGVAVGALNMLGAGV